MKKIIALALTASLGACASDTAERKPAATATSEPAPRERATRAEREDPTLTTPRTAGGERVGGESVGVKPVAVDTPAVRDERDVRDRDVGDRDVRDRNAAERGERNVAPARGPEADDTSLNERDRSGQTRTPEDQSNSSSDLENTRKIRSAIVDDDSLSFAAKNVKIVSNGGVVTLRGSVKNDAEKRAVETYAKQVVGATRVRNELDVER